MATIPPAHDPLIGVDLGNYRVEEKIAEGGMGLIYRAVHTVIGRQAAIKVLTEKYSNDQNMIKRLHREARAVNRIGHPNIVDIFDFGRTPDNRQYFAMEFLEGESLAPIIDRQKGGLPWSFISQVFTQSLDALGAAHDMGIVHRDIKPENFLVANAEDGSIIAKVLDFGIAKSVDAGPEGEQLTRAGSVMGTPEYIAPEQIRGKAVDGRADLYAMGVILFELITGKRPYSSAKVMNLLMSHLRDPIPPITPVAEEQGIPKHVIAAISKAMAKQPEDRFQDARSFAQALGLTPRSTASKDGTRPLPEMFWETDGSEQLEREASSPSIPRASIETRLSGNMRAVTESDLQSLGDVRKKNRLLWFVPIILILASAGAITYTAIKRFQSSKISQNNKLKHANNNATNELNAAKDLNELLFRVRKTLREGLLSSDPTIRRHAVQGLGELHDKGAKRKIFKILRSDPDSLVQNSAAFSLSQLGDPDISSELLEIRQEVEDNVQVAIDDALRRVHDKRGLSGLLKAIKSNKKSIRVTAALALADAGDQRAIKVLEPLISAQNSKLLTKILSALAKVNHSKAIQTLKKGIQSGDDPTRLQFAQALAKLGDETALPALRKLLENNKSNLSNQIVAAKSLSLLGDFSGLDTMKKGLSDHSAQIRILAADALGTLGDRVALSPLSTKLGDHQILVKTVAAEAISRILSLLPNKLIKSSQDWILAALNQGDWSTRYAAIGATNEMDPELAVELLGWAYQDKDARIRIAAISQLGNLSKTSPKARRFVESALSDKDSKVRIAAALALGKVGDKKAKAMLERVVFDKNKDVGMAAAGQLLKSGDTRHLSALKKALRSKNPATRKQAISALANWSNKEKRQALLAKGLKDSNSAVRLEAALALAQFGDSSGANILKKAVSNPRANKSKVIHALSSLGLLKTKEINRLSRNKDPALRAIAVNAAKESLSAKESKRVALRASRDDDAIVRRAAARALASLASKDSSLRTPLQKLSKDTDPAVRASAAIGLSRLPITHTASSKRGKNIEQQSALEIETNNVQPIKVAPTPKAPTLPTKPRPAKPGQSETEINFVQDSRQEASYKELIVRAELQVRGGRFKAALKTLSKARRIGKDRPPALFETGRVLFKIAIQKKSQGDKKSAARYGKRAKQFYIKYLQKAGNLGKQASNARAGIRDVKRLLRHL